MAETFTHFSVDERALIAELAAKLRPDLVSGKITGTTHQSVGEMNVGEMTAVNFVAMSRTAQFFATDLALTRAVPSPPLLGSVVAGKGREKRHLVSTTISHVDISALQTVHDAVVGGDTIFVTPGTLTGTTFTVRKPVTLTCEDIVTKKCIFDGLNTVTCAIVRSSTGGTTSFDGFTFTKGLWDTGGGNLHAYFSTMTLASCVVSRATGSSNWGAGLFVESSTVTLFDCVFSDNFASGGAILVSSGAVDLYGVSFSGNVLHPITGTGILDIFPGGGGGGFLLVRTL